MTRKAVYQGLATILGTVLLAAAVSSYGLAQSEEEPGGAAEGIKVHGHWVLEVLEPDGTLMTRHEFNNALVSGPDGTLRLQSLMLRTQSLGLWRIEVGHACLGTSGNTVSCFIEESNDPSASGANHFNNLTLNPVPGGLVLSGSATAPQNAEVGFVGTTVGECDGSVAPSSCIAIAGSSFTRATIPAVSVQTGQQIQVTVTISFS